MTALALDGGRALGIGIVLWPFTYCALLGIRRGGRALYRYARTHTRSTR